MVRSGIEFIVLSPKPLLSCNYSHWEPKVRYLLSVDLGHWIPWQRKCLPNFIQVKFYKEYRIRVSVRIWSVLHLKKFQKPQLVGRAGYCMVGCSCLFSFSCQAFFFFFPWNVCSWLYVSRRQKDNSGFVNLQQIFRYDKYMGNSRFKFCMGN